MPPIRRYLRISAYSVLEVRIYLDNPADAHRWLLHTSDPALPRIIQSIRPLVLPKLREENQRRRGTSGSTSSSSKKKSVKDVVQANDFEVSIFLTDLSTSHSLLTRAKVFAEKKGTERAGGSSRRPVEIGDDDGVEVVPNLRREESEEEMKVDMADIPMVGETTTASATVEISDSEDGDGGGDGETTGRGSRSRRRRRRRDGVGGGGDGDGDEAAEELPPPSPPPEPQDDKKKLGFRTSYDGFRIYGKILCLVVKRKGGSGPRGRQVTQDSTGQAVMENWIASTQENPGMAMLDE